MSDDDDASRRRRLPLLPELLPAPTIARLDRSPRERTLDHMRRLLGLAAATAALGGCGEDAQMVRVAAPPVVDPVPVPARHYPLAIRTIAKLVAVKGAKDTYDLTLSRPAVLGVSWSTNKPAAERIEVGDVRLDGDALVVRIRFEAPGAGGTLHVVAITEEGARDVLVELDDHPPPPIEVKLRDLQ